MMNSLTNNQKLKIFGGFNYPQKGHVNFSTVRDKSSEEFIFFKALADVVLDQEVCYMNRRTALIQRSLPYLLSTNQTITPKPSDFKSPFGNCGFIDGIQRRDKTKL